MEKLNATIARIDESIEDIELSFLESPSFKLLKPSLGSFQFILAAYESLLAALLPYCNNINQIDDLGRSI